MGEKANRLTRTELEELCLKQNIIIERDDPLTNSKIFLPNIEKINKMIREFDFLVDGESRGKAVNEISKIERFLYDNEENVDIKSKFLATYYSTASMYIENHRSLLEDKRSENWKYLFVNYFKLEDIYRYFNKDTGASTFFKDYTIYNDIVDLTYNVKLMEYLRSQVELQIPVDNDRDMPSKIEESNLKLVLLHELGVIDMLKEQITENTFPNMAKFLTVMCNEDPSSWRDVLDKLKNMNLQNDKDLLTELNLNKAHEIMSVFSIELEKE
ncbi:MAG: hypothetical protein KAR19_12515 [Bacteroidales bacterium]|nr:hypothetical protein [Bacteroidales bacterium]